MKVRRWKEYLVMMELSCVVLILRSKTLVVTARWSIMYGRNDGEDEMMPALTNKIPNHNHQARKRFFLCYVLSRDKKYYSRCTTLSLENRVRTRRPPLCEFRISLLPLGSWYVRMSQVQQPSNASPIPVFTWCTSLAL